MKKPTKRERMIGHILLDTSELGNNHGGLTEERLRRLIKLVEKVTEFDDETPLERMVRRSEAGELHNDYTVRISRYGKSLSKVGVKPRELRCVALTLIKLAPNILTKKLKKL